MTDDLDGDQDDGKLEDVQPDLSTNPEVVAPRSESSKFVRWFVWFVQHGKPIAGAIALASLVALAALDVQIPRSVKIGGVAFGAAALLVGRPTGRKVNELLGGPQLVWLVDVDLLDGPASGLYRCPTPRWQEWDVTDGDLWWATPNLAFGKNVDLEEQTVGGTWPGTLPEPVLMRALVYLRYNRERLLDSAKKGEVYDLNGWAMLREATISATKKVVRTFEEGTLPDDGESFRKEVDRALEQFDLDRGDIDSDPTEWQPGDGEPAPDFLKDSTITDQEVPADDD